MHAANRLTDVIDGVETEIYTETYFKDGIEYTYVRITANGVTTYTTTYVLDGEVITVDEGSYSEDANGQLSETNTYSYTQGDITYTTVTTTNGNTTTTEITVTELKDGQVILISESSTTEEVVNGKTVASSYTMKSYVDGVLHYEITTIIANDVTNTTTKWTGEDGIEYTQTSTYDANTGEVTSTETWIEDGKEHVETSVQTQNGEQTTVTITYTIDGVVQYTETYEI